MLCVTETEKEFIGALRQRIEAKTNGETTVEFVLCVVLPSSDTDHTRPNKEQSAEGTTEEFTVQLPLSLTVGELKWWLGDPDLQPEDKPVWNICQGHSHGGRTRYLDWANLYAPDFTELTNPLAGTSDPTDDTTLGSQGVVAGARVTINLFPQMPWKPLPHAPAYQEARTLMFEEIASFEPEPGTIPLVFISLHSGAGKFPESKLKGKQRNPEWLVDFVARHQGDGVVGRIILVDPLFAVEVDDPSCEWRLVSEEGAMWWHGEAYPAVSRLCHKILPITVILVRSCTCNMFTKRLQRWQGVPEDESQPDLCSIGDGPVLRRYKEKVAAAGGIVLLNICGCVETTTYRLSPKRRIEPVLPDPKDAKAIQAHQGEAAQEVSTEGDSDEEAEQFETLRLANWSEKAQAVLATRLG